MVVGTNGQVSFVHQQLFITKKEMIPNMSTKSGVFVIIVVLVAALIPGLAHADTPMIPAVGKSAVFTIGSRTVTVDGSSYLMDVAPYIDSAGRTMIPVRYLADTLGMTATWDAKTRTVNLTGNTWNDNESLTIGSDKLDWVNETQDGVTTMDTVPVIMPPGRTMLPARFVAQAVGYQVSWNPTAGTVTLSPQGTQPGTGGNGGPVSNIDSKIINNGGAPGNTPGPESRSPVTLN